MKSLNRRLFRKVLSEEIKVTDTDKIKAFSTGATRSNSENRIDPEGFFSPLVIDRVSQYLHKHRYQADGKLRSSDNWQQGLPFDTYAKSLWRHFLHFWTRHRGWKVKDSKAGANIEEDLCAIIFNASGYLHELRKNAVHKNRT